MCQLWEILRSGVRILWNSNSINSKRRNDAINQIIGKNAWWIWGAVKYCIQIISGNIKSNERSYLRRRIEKWVLYRILGDS